MHGCGLRQRLSVAGSIWDIETSSAAVLDWAREALPAGETVPSGAADFAIRIVVDQRLHGIPHGAPVFRGRDHLVLADYGGRGCFVFDLYRRTAFGAVSPELAADREYWRESIWPIALGLMCLVLDAVPLHTACVRHKGRGVLFAGLSGAGKSTLAATFARQGLEYMSDDWVYLSGRTGRVYSLPVNMKLLPDAVARFFPELRDLPVKKAMNGESSVLVDPATAFGTKRVYSCEPSVLVLLDRKKGHPPAVRQASEEDLIAFFCEPLDCVPECFASHRQRQIDLIRSLASRECVVLTCDGSPDEIASSILQVCEGESSVAPAKPMSQSEVVPLDLLRRHAATPYALRLEVRGTTVELRSSHNGLPLLRSAEPSFGASAVLVDLLAEPEAGESDSKPFFFADGALSGCTLGKGVRLVIDSASRRGFAFVPQQVIASGEFVETLSAVLDLAGLTQRSRGSIPVRRTASVVS